MQSEQNPTDLESKLAALTPERRARVEARSAELRQEVMRGRWFGLAPKVGHGWQWFLAYFRLSPVAVCGMSSGRGEYDDFHDWPDSEAGAPLHHYLHTCKRCGKEFRI